MSWVRVDDHFPHHPKVGAMGRYRYPAMGLHLEALCYCSTYLTDGVIPAHEVRKYPRPLVSVLLEAGLWHRLGDGNYQIHDYLDYNPSRDVVQAKRQEARVRMNNLRSSHEPVSISRATRAGASRPVPSRPLPVPEEVNETSESGDGQRLVDLQ